MSIPTNLITITKTNTITNNYTNVITVVGSNKKTVYQRQDIWSDWVVGVATIALFIIAIFAARSERNKLIKTIAKSEEANNLAMEANRTAINANKLSESKLVLEIDILLNSAQKLYGNKLLNVLKEKEFNDKVSLSKEMHEILRMEKDLAKEHYLNTISIFCGMALNDKYLYNKFKKDYKGVIFDIVKVNREEYKDFDKKREGIVELNNRLQSEIDF